MQVPGRLLAALFVVAVWQTGIAPADGSSGNAAFVSKHINRLQRPYQTKQCSLSSTVSSLAGAPLLIRPPLSKQIHVLWSSSDDGGSSSSNKNEKNAKKKPARREFLSSTGKGLLSSAAGFLTGGGGGGRWMKDFTGPRDNVAVAAESTLQQQQQQQSSSTLSPPGLVADLPMIRLKLPQDGTGREYVAIRLKINGKGPYDFMVDSGLTTELITPHLQKVLGMDRQRTSQVKGLGSGGATGADTLIELKGASLCCGNNLQDLPLPVLHAVITDFPQEHMDPAHDPVEGMIGMELLSQFDVEFDFPANRLRFYQPGTAAAALAAARSGSSKKLVEIPAVVINETGLIGIRVVAGTTRASTDGGPQQQQQPVLGIIDCGSAISAVNWAAASYLGLPTDKKDRVYQNGRSIYALGVDGNPFLMPTVPTRLSFAGDIVRDPGTGQPVGFQAPPAQWKPWSTINLAVGDLPAFSTVLGDGKRPYTGPAALIGLDVLAQQLFCFRGRQGQYTAPSIACESRIRNL